MSGAGRIARAFGDADLVARLADQATPPVAGYLTYNPGPGIYSRLERAVEAMPENVRVQELPGLIKRYKDGVPGWELKAVDLDSLAAGRDVIPRQEILAAVKERSPVYTHREVVLGGRPQQEEVVRYQVRGPDDEGFGLAPTPAGKALVYQPDPSPLGRGVSHGEAAFERFGQGGENYGELVVLSPEARRDGWGQNVHHFHKDYPSMHGRMMSPEVRSGLTNEGVAHARFDEHDGALRINEVQSDLGIHNRKQREAQPVGTGSWTPEVVEDLEARGVPHWFGGENNRLLFVQEDTSLPFPLEDTSMELLTKRLALYAAQNNLRRIEIASPQSIADALNMDLDRARHVYDKVLPSHWERLGRKMGGLAASPARRGLGPVTAVEGLREEVLGVARDMANEVPARARNYFDNLVVELGVGDASRVNWRAQQVADAVAAAGITDPSAMPRLMHLAHRRRQTLDAQMNASDFRAQLPKQAPPPGRAYDMSEEMFRRILQEGIPAAVAIGIGTDALLDRLDKEAPRPQMR